LAAYKINIRSDMTPASVNIGNIIMNAFVCWVLSEQTTLSKSGNTTPIPRTPKNKEVDCDRPVPYERVEVKGIIQ
jgi:hypothetical protein